ncbi:MAG: DUF4445 domain-containing protein [Prolixibacteraceae bacterium]|nr:DUF4445 domain-containing protein [Prolixibacteraceae bacterium]
MPKKVNIHLQPIHKKLSVIKGTPLIDVLHEFGVEFPCGGNGTCGRCKVKLLEGNLKTDAIQQQKLEQLNLADEWRLACFCNAESDITLEVSQFENIILADNTTFDFQPQNGFGIAVDLGTTTVVVQLLNLENGHLLDSVSEVNAQARFGGDLISRIQNSLDGNQIEMQEIIRKQIGKMIGSVLKKNRVKVSKIILVGNTVMHHIFSGLNVQSLSFYPFESPDMGMRQFSTKQLKWPLSETTEIRFYPSIGSFVGSDILAGIAATKMAEQEKLSVLIDLGTNGEIVVGNRDKIICASTAAGPAFEGAKISQGMRAATGAISSVKASPNPSGGGESGNKNLIINKTQLYCHVIGNGKAKGICGSGLIDAMAILLQQGKIGMFGEINSGEEKIELTPGIYITQQDIREFQLAKAAIATGLQILLNRLNISFNEIETVFIAGGFGNFLNIENVIRSGLIECEAEKIVKLGNTALIGAKLFLFEEDEFIQKILEKTTHINLESDANFQDIYVEKLLIG